MWHALLLVTITKEVAVRTFYFAFPAVLGMMPYASAVETTSTVPTLGGVYVHCIWVLVPQGLVVASVSGLAHDEA